MHPLGLNPIFPGAYNDFLIQQQFLTDSNFQRFL